MTEHGGDKLGKAKYMLPVKQSISPDPDPSAVNLCYVAIFTQPLPLVLLS
jgi:hypothetical protein